MRTIIADPELSLNLRRRGAIILGLFALVWAAAGASGLSAVGAASMVVYVVATLLSVTSLVVGVRSGAWPGAQRRRQLSEAWSRRVGLVNLGQLIAILVAIVVLLAVGRPTLVPALIALIVGVHFLPLARLLGQPQYRWTGLAMIAFAVAGFVLLGWASVPIWPGPSSASAPR